MMIIQPHQKKDGLSLLSSLKNKKATSDLWLPAVSPNDYPSIPRRTEGRLRFDVDQCPLPLKG